MTIVDAETGEVVRVHPAAELFPLIEGGEFDDLVEDIKTHGLIEPVWMYDDPEHGVVLLDGRNRWRACNEAGVKVQRRRYVGDDPIGFVISENVKRRHLTAGQLAAVGAEALPLYEAEAAKRKVESGRAAAEKQHHPERVEASRPQPTEPKKRAPQARDRAAATVGTSGRSVGRYKRIEQADEGLANLVKKGTLSLDRAERILRDREAEARKVAEAKAAAESAGVSTVVDLRHGDFRDVLTDLSDVQAIITDPPYPAEFIPLLGDLAVFADKVLAPDGVLVVLIGQTYLPEVYRLLDGYRPYRWTGCYLTAGAGYVSHQRRVQSNWKPLLVYGGGPRFSDVVRADGDTAAKQLHKWGQDYDAFHTIVERFTKRGDTVVDPFMGAGTTLLAAHALGRNAVGCDIDPESVATARERLS